MYETHEELRLTHGEKVLCIITTGVCIFLFTLYLLKAGYFEFLFIPFAAFIVWGIVAGVYAYYWWKLSQAATIEKIFPEKVRWYRMEPRESTFGGRFDPKVYTREFYARRTGANLLQLKIVYPFDPKTGGQSVKIYYKSFAEMFNHWQKMPPRRIRKLEEEKR